MIFEDIFSFTFNVLYLKFIYLKLKVSLLFYFFFSSNFLNLLFHFFLFSDISHVLLNGMQCIYSIVIFILCCTLLPLLCINRLPCCRSVVNVVIMHPDKDGRDQGRVFPYCFFLMRSSYHNIHCILEHGTSRSFTKQTWS